MTTTVPRLPETRKMPWQPVVDDMTLHELCAELFASLPRSDQRAKGLVYLRGLLHAQGRKSIRKLALVSGGQVNEQSLHHFVCGSTWDWMPIREALAQHITRALPVHAWVVRPMITPKAGEHSVGVDRGFSTDLGQMLNAQHAVGVWAAADENSCPVNWRLRLSSAWADDAARRVRAAIPDGVRAETTGSCAVTAYLEMVRFLGLPTRPVVMDARQDSAFDSAAAVVRGLSRAQRPLMVRVTAEMPLHPAYADRPGYTSRPATAQQIMAAVRELRRPVYPPGADLTGVLVATTPVRLPDLDRHRLHLMGEWSARNGSPSAYWLTDLSPDNLVALVSLTRLIDRVDEDFERITEQVGIREYSARSYDGWHRHATLASAAHAVATLSAFAFSHSETG